MRVSSPSWLLASSIAILGACGGSGAAPPAVPAPKPHTGPTETALLAGGCFWCIEAAFEGVPGVIEAVSGYTGGSEPNPTYEQVGSGRTGHREAVQVRFDPTRITYAQVLDLFWRQIDPTDPGGQFADRGPQYETAIYVASDEQRRIAEASKASLAKVRSLEKPVVTPILPAGPFYAAESYHQDYSVQNEKRYEAYKNGSGRGPYIERTWKGTPPIPAETEAPAAPKGATPMECPKPADAELRKQLTALQYEVTQNDATERPFANEYWDNHEPGIYVDVVTGEPLFSSTDKFDSGTGWPSFTKPLVSENVVQESNAGVGYLHAEVRSRGADSHLGHVFDDGPGPSGLRYCINSAALKFIPASELEAKGYGKYRSAVEAKPEK